MPPPLARYPARQTPLVSLLSAWQTQPPPVATAPHARAPERLAQWLSVADAITLHGALPGLRRARAAKPDAAARPTAAPDLADALSALRTALQRSFVAPPHSRVEPSRATDFAAHHQRYLNHQRRINVALDAFRTHAREVLSQCSPELAELAALDALLQRLLAEREQSLLSRVPVLLKNRFALLRPADDAAAPAADPGAAPNTAWLAAFEQDFQAALLAELELRLQPALGLVEALSQADDSRAAY